MIDLDLIVDELEIESMEDIFDVAWLIGTIRDHNPDVTGAELRDTGVEIARRLLGRGVEFGTFSGSDFDPWPSATVPDQLNDAWQMLGREPTLGDIGWFKNRQLDYRPS